MKATSDGNVRNNSQIVIVMPETVYGVYQLRCMRECGNAEAGVTYNVCCCPKK